MLGEIKIFFGKVVDVSDDLKINRCRISIDGLTDEIKPEDLPWYFPWYGLSYLPIKDDVVPVLVFDDNFSTCFYGNKLDLVDLKLDDGDYENYLEIFKRSIDDKNVSLTYKKSTGIEFINDKYKIQIEKDKLSLFNDTLGITIEKDKINIGEKSGEATLLGDKTVKHLLDIVKHQQETIDGMLTIFDAISAACVTPFTLPIKAALTPLTITYKASLKISNTKLETNNTKNNLQSQKVFIK